MKYVIQNIAGGDIESIGGNRRLPASNETPGSTYVVPF